MAKPGGKAVIIKTDGTRETVDWTQENAYNVLNAAVGGYIEYLQLPRHGFDMYVNEDGISEGLAPNPLATTLMMEEYGIVPPIFGNTIIVGLSDEDGDMTTLRPDQINKIHEHATKIKFEWVEGSDLLNASIDLDDIPPSVKDESALETFLRLEREDNMTPLTDDPIPGEEEE